jgi:hypothetical protein
MHQSGIIAAGVPSELPLAAFVISGSPVRIRRVAPADENGIDRGSFGQSVVAIIDCLDESGPTLASVSRDRSLPVATREGATLIIAMRHGSDAIPILMELAQSGSETFAPKLISILRQKGRV